MLEFTVEDFGPIASAELQLARFNVFVGKNSSGKSMCLKLIYSAFLGVKKYFEHLARKHYLLVSSELVKKVQEALSNNESLNVTRFLVENLERLLESKKTSKILGSFIAEELRSVFLVEDLGELVRLGSDKAEFTLKSDSLFVRGVISREGVVRANISFNWEAIGRLTIKISPSVGYYYLSEDNIAVEVTKGKTSEKFRIIFPFEGEKIEPKNIDRAIAFAARLYARFLYREIPHLPFLIIDNRSSVPLIMDIVKKLPIENPELYYNISEIIPKTLLNYTKLTLDTQNVARTMSEDLQGFLRENFDLNLFFDSNSQTLYFEVEINDRRLLLPLSRGSSGSKEIFSLLLLLASDKTVGQLGRKKLYLIEELEAHLHPAAQRDLTYILAKKVSENDDTVIIITTHSDWIIKVLDLMVIANYVEEKKKKIVPVTLSVKDVTINLFKYSEELKGYTVRQVKVSKNGIPETEFTKINEELYDQLVTLTSED